MDARGKRGEYGIHLTFSLPLLLYQRELSLCLLLFGVGLLPQDLLPAACSHYEYVEQQNLRNGVQKKAVRSLGAAPQKASNELVSGSHKMRSPHRLASSARGYVYPCFSAMLCYNQGYTHQTTKRWDFHLFNSQSSKACSP